jgi:hypothetical protein
MIHQWDEFSKSLAEPVPRRESLRRLGAVFAGSVLGPLGAATAWARGPDPCRSFCKCRNKSEQTACLAACNACKGNTSHVCGFCGRYACTDVLNDFDNCGACGHICPQPGPNESGACVNGKCAYTCINGTARCNGTCTVLDRDPNNCGACGNACGGATLYCSDGNCVTCEAAGLANCNGTCRDLNWDSDNCGACGNVCVGDTHCDGNGVCVGCPPGYTWCGWICLDLSSDPLNCGACFNACGDGSFCSGGICTGNGWPYPY